MSKDQRLTQSQIYINNVKDLLKVLDTNIGNDGDAFARIAAANAAAKSPQVAATIDIVRDAATNLSNEFKTQQDIMLTAVNG